MLVCTECGGKNVQISAWVDANTSEYVSEGIGDTWCDDCEDDDIGLMDETEFLEKYENKLYNVIITLYEEGENGDAVQLGRKMYSIEEQCDASKNLLKRLLYKCNKVDSEFNYTYDDIDWYEINENEIHMDFIKK